MNMTIKRARLTLVRAWRRERDAAMMLAETAMPYNVRQLRQRLKRAVEYRRAAKRNLELLQVKLNGLDVDTFEEPT